MRKYVFAALISRYYCDLSNAFFIHFHFHNIRIRRTSGRSLGTFYQAILFLLPRPI